MPDQLLEGGCQCGAVRYRIDGSPALAALCHCSMCRRAHAAPAVAWAMYQRSQVSFTGEPPTTYESSPGAQRAFCPRCGTQISFTGRIHSGAHRHRGRKSRRSEPGSAHAPLLGIDAPAMGAFRRRVAKVCGVPSGRVAAQAKERTMPDIDKVFAGSIPKLYEQYLVPLIFEPYAADLAGRVASRHPTACPRDCRRHRCRDSRPGIRPAGKRPDRRHGLESADAGPGCRDRY